VHLRRLLAKHIFKRCGENFKCFQHTEFSFGYNLEVGDDVVVHYVGWLTNGQQFDSSRARRDPLDFALGAGDVIKGWDQGIEGMRTGGKRKLTIPAELAYGDKGCGGVIPPDATLVFEVELLEIA